MTERRWTSSADYVCRSIFRQFGKEHRSKSITSGLSRDTFDNCLIPNHAMPWYMPMEQQRSPSDFCAAVQPFVSLLILGFIARKNNTLFTCCFSKTCRTKRNLQIQMHYRVQTSRSRRALVRKFQIIEVIECARCHVHSMFPFFSQRSFITFLWFGFILYIVDFIIFTCFTEWLPLIWRSVLKCFVASLSFAQARIGFLGLVDRDPVDLISTIQSFTRRITLSFLFHFLQRSTTD